MIIGLGKVSMVRARFRWSRQDFDGHLYGIRGIVEGLVLSRGLGAKHTSASNLPFMSRIPAEFLGLAWCK